jgi:hypothetical protein
LGPWSGGKSSIVNYLLGTEYTQNALKTGMREKPKKKHMPHPIVGFYNSLVNQALNRQPLSSRS